MKYKIDNPDDIIDFWIPAFEAISITQFEKLSENLKFPVKVSAELRSIAKDFSLSVLGYFGRDIPEEASNKLFVQSEEVDPLIQIWENTFIRLQSSGYAEEVYLWGKRIYQFKTHPIVHSSMSEWDILLLDWSFYPLDPQWITLNLPQKVTGKLQLIAMEYLVYSQDLRFLIKRIEEAANDTWDGYVLNTLHSQSWIANIANDIIRISKWKKILDTLSPQELKILDEWGYASFMKVNEINYFSLLHLVDELEVKQSEYDWITK